MKKIYTITIFVLICLTFISGCTGAIDHKVVTNDASNNEFNEQYLKIQKERHEVSTEPMTIAVFRPIMHDEKLQSEIEMQFDYGNSAWNFYNMDYEFPTSEQTEIEMKYVSVYYNPVDYPGELLKSLGKDENLKDGEIHVDGLYRRKVYSYKGIDYYVNFTPNGDGECTGPYPDSYEITLLLDDKYKAYIEFYGGNEDELKDDIVHSLIDSFYFEKLPDLTIKPYDFSSTENSSDE